MERETEQEGRQANYELLRIIAMFMVVTLHYLNHTGMLLTAGGEGGGRQIPRNAGGIFLYRGR